MYTILHNMAATYVSDWCVCADNQTCNLRLNYHNTLVSSVKHRTNWHYARWMIVILTNQRPAFERVDKHMSGTTILSVTLRSVGWTSFVISYVLYRYLHIRFVMYQFIGNLFNRKWEHVYKAGIADNSTT